MCDDNGLFEHARFDRPRRDHGYCTDDAGRALSLACRLPADLHACDLRLRIVTADSQIARYEVETLLV